MTTEDKLKADIEYNRQNPIFADEQDDIFGTHEQGRYMLDTTNEEGEDVYRFVFDNGNVYEINQDTGEIVDKGTLSPSVFIHRHLQNLLDEFRITNNLPLSVSGEVMCAPYEVASRPFVRIVIDRNARVIGITNFFLALEYQHQNIGKNFLKVAYALCKKYKYRLRLLHCVSTFYDRMQTRGATVITEKEHL